MLSIYISPNLLVSGIDVQIVRKSIKNLHLAVYPPNGHVRVAAPENITDDNVRLAVVSKLSWIKNQQQDFKNQPRQTERKYISGECHYYLGKRYRLEVIEREGKPEVEHLKAGKLKLFVKSGASVTTKEKQITEWYRGQLKATIPSLLEKWQPKVGKIAADWGIRKMRTKWGSCNIKKRRIWLNLELAKKPLECVEYIVVHELIHLHERNHNERFKSLMEKNLPNWRSLQKLLNTAPLAHEDWEY
ncbi:M48 family metallopeptidase [Teredinibacter purpureus]|uniref:M48 family metallopeptidase n=1 Tax=Teredinibacter purpureus TaxID=2731756 RepID=UPI0005F7AD6D|nr:SprT family zinc-dependent metalloprotease [Teredinibacter purpureus]